MFRLESQCQSTSQVMTELLVHTVCQPLVTLMLSTRIAQTLSSTSIDNLWSKRLSHQVDLPQVEQTWSSQELGSTSNHNMASCHSAKLATIQSEPSTSLRTGSSARLQLHLILELHHQSLFLSTELISRTLDLPSATMRSQSSLIFSQDLVALREELRFG